MSKDGYSRKDLIRAVNHYDSKGHKVGGRKPGMFVTTNHYDASGKKMASSHDRLFYDQCHHKK